MKKITASPLSRDQIITRSAGIALISGFLIAARLYDPFKLQLITCRFKKLTGCDCPTCGLSRSVHSLLSFNIFDSITYNPLGIILISGLIVFLAKFAAELVAGKEIIISISKPLGKFIIFLMLVLVISAWILKLRPGI